MDSPCELEGVVKEAIVAFHDRLVKWRSFLKTASEDHILSYIFSCEILRSHRGDDEDYFLIVYDTVAFGKQVDRCQQCSVTYKRSSFSYKRNISILINYLPQIQFNIIFQVFALFGVSGQSIGPTFRGSSRPSRKPGTGGYIIQGIGHWCSRIVNEQLMLMESKVIT